MVSYESLVPFLLMSVMMCSIPGPSTLYVLSQSLSSEWRKPVLATAGILCSNLVWISFCSFGIGAVIRDSQPALNLLRIIGACYLIYLGVAHWRKATSPLVTITSSQNKSRMVFINGLLTSLSNPKALLFYVSFLPQFVTGDTSITQQLFTLGLLNILVMTIVFAVYAIAGLGLSRHLHNLRLITCIKRIIGTILIVFGISLFRLDFANDS